MHASVTAYLLLLLLGLSSCGFGMEPKAGDVPTAMTPAGATVRLIVQLHGEVPQDPKALLAEIRQVTGAASVTWVSLLTPDTFVVNLIPAKDRNVDNLVSALKTVRVVKLVEVDTKSKHH